MGWPECVVGQWVLICPCFTALPALSHPGDLVEDASGRGRDMADGTVREIFHSHTDRHDWNLQRYNLQPSFRHTDVSNLLKSLEHKAIPYSPYAPP